MRTCKVFGLYLIIQRFILMAFLIISVVGCYGLRMWLYEPPIESFAYTHQLGMAVYNDSAEPFTSKELVEFNQDLFDARDKLKRCLKDRSFPSNVESDILSKPIVFIASDKIHAINPLAGAFTNIKIIAIDRYPLDLVSTITHEWIHVYLFLMDIDKIGEHTDPLFYECIQSNKAIMDDVDRKNKRRHGLDSNKVPRL